MIGSLTTPLSKRLTFATSAACLAGDMFLWTMPSPPSCAMAIARRASVTVSIAADSSGMLSAIERGEAGLEADVAGDDEGMRGNEQDVVEGQRFPDDTHVTFSYAQKRIIPASAGAGEPRRATPANETGSPAPVRETVGRV